MVERMTYTAADGQVFEAEDAKQYVDPEKIQAAVEKCVSTVETEIKGIIEKLQGISADATDALIVKGANIAPALEEYCNSLGSVDVGSFFDGIYDKAVSKYNEMQTKFNEEAKAKADAATAAYNERQAESSE